MKLLAATVLAGLTLMGCTRLPGDKDCDRAIASMATAYVNGIATDTQYYEELGLDAVCRGIYPPLPDRPSR
jgi:hypothetical protein